MGFRVYFTKDHSVYYDSDAYSLHYPEEPVDFSTLEKRLFDCLVENRPNPVPPKKLLTLWEGRDQEIGSPRTDQESERHLVYPAVSKLRAKLRMHGYHYDQYIKTTYGTGYKYTGPDPVDNKDDPSSITPSANDPSHPEDDAVLTHDDPITTAAPAPEDDHLSPDRKRKALLLFRDSIRNTAEETIQTALQDLLNADGREKLTGIRITIKHWLPQYFRAIVPSVSIDDLNRDITTMEEAIRRGEQHLNSMVSNIVDELNSREHHSELLDIKIQLLQNILIWHIIVAKLAIMISTQEEAVERAARRIGKETRLPTIERSLKQNQDVYRYAKDGAERADYDLDEQINTHTTDIPFI